MSRPQVRLNALKAELAESEERERLAQNTQRSAHHRVVAEWSVQKELREQIERMEESE